MSTIILIAAAAAIHGQPFSPEQCAALEAINAARRELGIEEARLDPKLCDAAVRHANYLKANPPVGSAHLEDPDGIGFNGKTLADRTKACGFKGAVAEDVCWLRSNVPVPDWPRLARESVSTLLDVPYHRLALIRPGRLLVGIGISSSVVVDMNYPQRDGVVVYPAPGQKAVPGEILINEVPDPLRVHGLGLPGGIPRRCGPVVSILAPGHHGLRVVSASISSELEGPVEVLINDSQNDDHLDDAAFIIPVHALMPLTSYTVSVVERDKEGWEHKDTQTLVTATAKGSRAPALYWPHSNGATFALYPGVVPNDPDVAEAVIVGPGEKRTTVEFRRDDEGTTFCTGSLPWTPIQWEVYDQSGHLKGGGEFVLASSVTTR